MDYEKILGSIVEDLQADVEFDLDEGKWVARSSVYVGDVLIAARWDSNGDVEVVDCMHDVPHDCRDLSNVGEWIEDHLCSSSELEDMYHDELYDYDEWNEHGFRDAADYWHYRI